MQVIPLTKREQFKKLKPWDILIVKWSDYYVKHTPECKKIMFYRIHKKQDNEIICQMKNNHWFNYDKYRNNDSVALEVFQVMDD